MSGPSSGAIRAARAADRAWPFAAVAAFAIFGVAPLAAYLSGLVFRFPSALRETVANEGETARLVSLLGNTTTLAALAATIALLAGATLFLALVSLPAKGPARAIAALAVASPLLLSGRLSTIAWIQTFGVAGWFTAGAKELGEAFGALPPRILYSTAGCALAMGVRFSPVVAAALWLGARGIPAEAFDATAVAGGPRRSWRVAAGGPLRPWILAGWWIAFVAALLESQTPGLLRARVFAVEIFAAYDVRFDAARAALLAVPLVAIAWLAAGAAGAMAGRARRAADAGAFRPDDLPALARADAMPARAGAAAIVALGTGLPLFATARAIGEDPGSLSAAWETAISQAATSVVVAGSAAAGATLVAAGALRVAGESAAARRAFDVLALAMFATPASVLSFAQIEFWNRDATAAIHDRGAMLPLGLAVAVFPIAWVVLSARLGRTPPGAAELERSAAPTASRARWIVVVAPRLAGPALVAFAIAFSIAIHDAETSVLLAAPGQETLAVRAQTLFHYAPDALVASLCLLAWAAIAASLVALGLLACAFRAALRRYFPEIRLE